MWYITVKMHDRQNYLIFQSKKHYRLAIFLLSLKIFWILMSKKGYPIIRRILPRQDGLKGFLHTVKSSLTCGLFTGCLQSGKLHTEGPSMYLIWNHVEWDPVVPWALAFWKEFLHCCIERIPHPWEICPWGWRFCKGNKTEQKCSD